MLLSKLSGWALVAASALLLILTYVGWRLRRERAKEEAKQHQEDLSRADYEGMAAEDK
jgi:membrane protein implicated in regulation of membrane protease activity